MAKYNLTPPTPIKPDKGPVHMSSELAEKIWFEMFNMCLRRRGPNAGLADQEDHEEAIQYANVALEMARKGISL